MSNTVAKAASEFLYLAPGAISIDRETRQRQENIHEREELKQSIANLGILNPIIVRRLPDGTNKLVAGERRLLSAMELGLSQVPIRLFESLSAEEAEIVELEENAKRTDLNWRDNVKAIGRLHTIYSKKFGTSWTIGKTAQKIALGEAQTGRVIFVYKQIDSGKISRAEGIQQAYNTLHRFAERQAESIVSDIMANGATLFGKETQAPTAVPVAEDGASGSDFAITGALSLSREGPSSLTNPATEPPTILVKDIDISLSATTAPTNSISDMPILCANFIEWAKTYSGPKFTLVHCDFPYGNYKGGDSQGSLSPLDTEDFYDNTESVYWNLLDALTDNIDRIMSYSAHLLFWFNMNFYTETVKRLRTAGLMVHDHPIIWHKTGGPGGLGVVPGTAVTYPRRTYDTALLAVRGNRPLAKPGMNSYAAPTVGNKIHPSQKSEPMLRFFLSMLVDETTTMFDPTAGSATALRAGEDLGAKHILGLELDPNYAKSANEATLRARVLRNSGR